MNADPCGSASGFTALKKGRKHEQIKLFQVQLYSFEENVMI